MKIVFIRASLIVLFPLASAYADFPLCPPPASVLAPVWAFQGVRNLESKTPTTAPSQKSYEYKKCEGSKDESRGTLTANRRIVIFFNGMDTACTELGRGLWREFLEAEEFKENTEFIGLPADGQEAFYDCLSEKLSQTFIDENGETRAPSVLTFGYSNGSYAMHSFNEEMKKRGITIDFSASLEGVPHMDERKVIGDESFTFPKNTKVAEDWLVAGTNAGDLTLGIEGRKMHESFRGQLTTRQIEGTGGHLSFTRSPVVQKLLFDSIRSVPTSRASFKFDPEKVPKDGKKKPEYIYKKDGSLKSPLLKSTQKKKSD